MSKRRAWALVSGTLVIVAVVGAAGLYAGGYYSPEAERERVAREYQERMQEAYENDTYGSTTPQGTLNLFIDALEERNFEKASKYFLPEDREEEKQKITEAASNDNLNKILDRLRSLSLSSKKESRYIYTSTNDKGVVEYRVSIWKNPETGVWKIANL